jgi:hypothetical protein
MKSGAPITLKVNVGVVSLVTPPGALLPLGPLTMVSDGGVVSRTVVTVFDETVRLARSEKLSVAVFG